MKTMKYTLFIFLIFSIKAHAQKTLGIYRVIEKTAMKFDEQAEEFNFDTVPVPMKSLNAKIMFTADQMLIIDDDTTYINLGAGSKPVEDSTSVSMGWDDADFKGDACSVYMYMYTNKEYHKVIIYYEEEQIGYLYMLSSLKTDIIPTASSVSGAVKKKSN